MTAAAGPPPRSLTLPDGRHLAFLCVGQPGGRPVMHCHGGLSCRLEIAFADALCRKLGIAWIAADRPGIGRSDFCPGRKMADWAQDAAALADHLGIDRFAVTGWSAGGPYALACGAALPGRVTGVATVAGMAPLRDRADISALGMAADRFLFSFAGRQAAYCKAVMALTRALPAALTRMSVQRMLSHGADHAGLPLNAATDISASFIEALRPGVAGTVWDYRLLGGQWGFPFKDITVPAYVWHGQADDLLPCEHASRLAADIRGARLRILQDAGHFILQRCCHEILAELIGTA